MERLILILIVLTAVLKSLKLLIKKNWFTRNFDPYIKHCYCIVWSVEKTESKNIQVTKTNKEKIMLLTKCVVWNSKKSRLIKRQEARCMKRMRY